MKEKDNIKKTKVTKEKKEKHNENKDKISYTKVMWVITIWPYLNQVAVAVLVRGSFQFLEFEFD